MTEIMGYRIREWVPIYPSDKFIWDEHSRTFYCYYSDFGGRNIDSELFENFSIRGFGIKSIETDKVIYFVKLGNNPIDTDQECYYTVVLCQDVDNMKIVVEPDR